MARADVINLLYAKNKNPLEFTFDSLWIPAMYNYLTADDISQLNHIANSIRYNANINLKYKLINDIMNRRGFRKYHAGTNRVVYTHLEDPRFVAKIAIDKVGLEDNPKEFENQKLLKPFVTKVFEVSPCGTVAFVERVQPITSIQEFKSIADDVYDVLTECILGLYALEDIGTEFFMNWGIRNGFGPCLLDFPYVFELDGNKLHCNLPELDKITGLPTGRVCDGEIDYDTGFNKLLCTKCGKMYHARDLSILKQQKLIMLKGEAAMSFKVILTRGDEIVGGIQNSSDIIVPPIKRQAIETVPVSSGIRCNIVRVDENGNVLSTPEPKEEFLFTEHNRVDEKIPYAVVEEAAEEVPSPDDDVKESTSPKMAEITITDDETGEVVSKALIDINPEPTQQDLPDINTEDTKDIVTEFINNTGASIYEAFKQYAKDQGYIVIEDNEEDSSDDTLSDTDNASDIPEDAEVESKSDNVSDSVDIITLDTSKNIDLESVSDVGYCPVDDEQSQDNSPEPYDINNDIAMRNAIAESQIDINRKAERYQNKKKHKKHKNRNRFIDQY